MIASDLHLGAGRNAGGEWLPTEDFRWQDDFASFLQAIDEAGKGATDLVLNGDTFELWQSTTDDCRLGTRGWAARSRKRSPDWNAWSPRMRQISPHWGRSREAARTG